jgi:hypothetical protein
MLMLSGSENNLQPEPIVTVNAKNAKPSAKNVKPNAPNLLLLLHAPLPLQLHLAPLTSHPTSPPFVAHSVDWIAVPRGVINHRKSGRFQPGQ